MISILMSRISIKVTSDGCGCHVKLCNNNALLKADSLLIKDDKNISVNRGVFLLLII